VKSVEWLAVESQREAVLDYAKLGRRLRGKVKEVAVAVAAGDYTERTDGGLTVAGVELAPDEVSWRTRVAMGQGFAARDGLAVALDLALDPGLMREATARELA